MAKKTSSMQIQVNTPCKENWEGMTPINTGRFCSSCEKTVVDFSQMTDYELTNFFKAQPKNICGRYRNDQLNRPIELPRPEGLWQKWKTRAAIIAGLLIGNEVQAQSTPSVAVHQTDIKQQAAPNNSSFISGTITDEAGEGLIAANVKIVDFNGVFKAGGTTDWNGNFKILKPEGANDLRLVISYIGFATEEVELTKEVLATEIKVALKEGIKLEEVVVTGYSIRLKTQHTMGLFVSSTDIEKEVVKKTPKVEEKDIEPKPSVKAVQVFPNPFINEISIDILIEKQDAYLFQLYTMSGQLVQAETKVLEQGQQNISLNIKEELAAASYIFVLTQNGVNIHTQQILKVNNRQDQSERNENY